MPITLLVLANPADRRLRMLERLPEDTRIAAGERVEAFEATAPEAGVILCLSSSRELLEQVWKIAPRVRWVHCGSAGVDSLLFPALVESAVPLTNARGVFSGALSEFALASILFFAKDLRRMVRSQAAGEWDPFDLEAIEGQTLGIVGYGDIGRAVAARAQPLGMKIVPLRRSPGQYSKADLLALSDYVVLAAPLTPETKGLIGEAELRKMKSSAVLINVGRGPVVDEPALVRALEEKWIRGAALDVFEQEPLPAAHPFYGLENVLLSPHCADHTAGWQEQTMEVFLENFERFRKREPLKNVVDKRRGY